MRFAAGQRPLFKAAFASGIGKSRHPEVHRAEEPVEAAFMACVREVCGGDEAAAEALGDAVPTTAHGCAMLHLAETVRCCGGEPHATTVTDISAAARPRASRRRPVISPRIGNDSYRIRPPSWPGPATGPVTAAGTA